MNGKWEKEGLKVLKEINEILGNSKNLDIKNLNDYEKIILRFLGMNSIIIKELNSMNKIPLDDPPQEYIEKLVKNLSKVMEDNPQLQHHMENFLEYSQTVEYCKIRLSIYRGDRFETSLIRKFLEEFEKAEIVNKHRVKKSFGEIFKYLKHLPTPDDLYLLSRYHELGMDTEKIETDTMQSLFMSIFDQFFTKKDKLFDLPERKLIDCVRDFVSRFGRALEPYLIAILGSIYNLQQVKKNQNLTNLNIVSGII